MAAYLESMSLKSPVARDMRDRMAQHTTKRLWHQLTKELRNFIILEEVQPLLVDFYKNYINDIAGRLNPFQLVEIVIHVIRNVSDMDEALKFLDDTYEKVSSNTEATQLIKITRAQIILENSSDEMSLRKVRDTVKELAPELERQDGVSLVHSRFYEMAALYYSKQANHAQYYRNALRYLGCREDLNAAFDADYEPIGFKLCLAALLADDVYNFGELLQHKILEPVRAGANKWIVDLLEAFNSGDINQVQALSHLWESQPDLQAHKQKLTEKWMLSALMESVFSRAARDRVLPFSYISQRTGLDIDQVEHLIMRGLSLNLVKGSIDQVEQTATFTWVQPRVLSKSQILVMGNRVNNWVADVSRKEENIYRRAQEIIDF